jgi:hypothetical protein
MEMDKDVDVDMEMDIDTSMDMDSEKDKENGPGIDRCTIKGSRGSIRFALLFYNEDVWMFG